MDKLAANGIRYTNFHVTGLCSTTRASLITGRNHHSVGVGFLSNFDTGFPGYRGAITPAAATLAEILRAAGYSSYATGKWHLTPPIEMSAAGPFDQWPTQRGFDRYYGFPWGEDDQWAPELWYDQHRVEVPDVPDYHLSSDLVTKSTEFIADHVTSKPDNPFFLYLAFGACHAPHQAPRDYIDKYQGRFDDGWDVDRQQTLARQLDLELFPQTTDLAPLNPGVLPWAEVPADRQRLYARMQEVYAGFMEHTDAQIGRLVDYLAKYDLLDNTVVMVMSDNGASGEGGEHGTSNEYRYFMGLGDSVDDAMAAYDDLGGPNAHNHYPAGWAQAGNTPLKFYKQYTYGGGVRAPLIVHWPAGLDSTAPLRTQFHNVTDILPTIVELAGCEVPEVYRGVAQLPIHGTSHGLHLHRPRGCQHSLVPVLRNGRVPGNRRRRLESSGVSRTWSPFRRGPLGAVPTGGRLLRVPRPSLRVSGRGATVARPLVARRPAQWRAAIGRSDGRSSERHRSRR